MMLEEHLRQDRLRFGTEYERVHEELDATFSQIGHPHRKDTHYLEWIINKYINKEWSIEETRAAIWHMLDDCSAIMLEDDWLTGPEILKRTKNGKG